MIPANNNNALIEQLKGHFGLSGDPFASISNVFYEGAQRKHCLETLRHLATFGDMVLLLTGDPGSGKSTLIRQFQKTQIDELRVFAVDAEAELSASSNSFHAVTKFADLVQLTKVSDEPLQQTVARLVQNLDKHFDSEGERTLLIIDNADKLPTKELQIYISCFRDLPPETGAVMLFSGLNSLLQFTKQETSVSADEWVHQIQVKALLQEEQVEYLQQRLQKVGFNQKLKLTDSQMKHLVEVSKGLPGRINKIFCSVVLEPGLLKIEQSNSHKVSKKIIIGIFSLLFLSFLFVSYQHDLFNLVGKNTASEKSEEIDRAQSKEFSPEESRFLQAERLKRLRMLERALLGSGNPLEENIQERVSINEKVMKPKDTDSIDVVIKDDKTKNIDVVNSMPEQTINSTRQSVQKITKSAPLPTSQALVKKVVSIAPSISKASKPKGFKSKAWVQLQPKTAYSAQILGSFKEDTALKFMEKLGDMGQEIFYLRTFHKGKPWFVVFYGVYPDKLTVKKAIAKSPRVIKSQEPWLRRFDSILKSYPSL